MLTLTATNTIAGVSGTASAITYTIFGMTLLSGAETYGILAQGQLPNSVGTLYTVAASTTAFIKQIILVNTTGSSVSGNILYANGTTASNQITGSILIPANGTAMLDDDGLAVYDANGSRLGTTVTPSALPSGTTAATQSALNASTLVATTAYVDSAVTAYSASNSTIYQTTVNLGTQPVKSGKFTITGAGFTPGNQVEVWQSGLRPGGTSSLQDSTQWDQINATGYVVNPTTIQVYWGSLTYVCGSWTFNYNLG